MVDPSEKLPNNHAYDAQCLGLANALFEFFEHSSQTSPVGEIERFAGKLIERFADASASQIAVSPAPDVLQSADEMKMAELHDPALTLAEPDNSRNLVGDRGADASVYVSGNGCECLRPALHILSAGKEHRVEKGRSILIAGLDRHYIQHPIFSTKAKVKSVQDQDQRPSGHAQHARSEYKPSQSLPPTVADCLRRKGNAWRQAFHRSSLYQNACNKTGVLRQRLRPRFFARILHVRLQQLH